MEERISKYCNIEKENKENKRFFFHYNKPESKRQGKNVLTVHWKGECIPVNSVKCHVAIESHSNKRQPYCVLRGWASSVTLVENDNNTLAIIS